MVIFTACVCALCVYHKFPVFRLVVETKKASVGTLTNRPLVRKGIILEVNCLPWVVT